MYSKKKELGFLALGQDDGFDPTEDRLDGSSNFNNWKARVIAIFEEHDIDHYVTMVVAKPTSNAGRASFKRNQAKARRIIYDSVKEHIMSIITPLKC